MAAEAEQKVKEFRSQYVKAGVACTADLLPLALSFTTKRVVKETTDRLVEQCMATEAEETQAKRAAEDAQAEAWTTLTKHPGATGTRLATVEDLATKRNPHQCGWGVAGRRCCSATQGNVQQYQLPNQPLRPVRGLTEHCGRAFRVACSPIMVCNTPKARHPGSPLPVIRWMGDKSRCT
ncbi:hypothetical protein ACFWIN_20850 [Streptomyces sp. NPDC127049]|uniref:hypothetical protein n=1 Tax=Streptomyces sp. NPDC127049 TaxID=3347118 RepID=UPI003659DD69